MPEMTRKVTTFIEECWAELMKVTWPDKEQLRTVTIVVIIFTIVVSATIGLMDFVVSRIIGFIMGLFGA